MRICLSAHCCPPGACTGGAGAFFKIPFGRPDVVRLGTGGCGGGLLTVVCDIVRVVQRVSLLNIRDRDADLCKIKEQSL